MNAAPPPPPLPNAVACLKPTRTAQEFRWKFLKGQQTHATPLHEQAPTVDVSLQWKEAGYRGVPPTPRSGCSCLVIDDDCIIFGGTLMVQQQQQQQQLDGIGSPAATMHGFSRVYFNDLVYFRFSAGSAGSRTGVWVHQPKRSGELWPSARSGHAAAAVGGRMFIFGGWFESSSSGRMIFLQDFYFLEPASVIWGVPRASGCPPSARAYAAAVGFKDSFVLVGGTEGHLPWQFKNDVHVFSLKFNVAPGHTARLTPNKSDLTTGVWSRCCMGGGPPFPLGRAQHAAASVSQDTIIVFGGVRNSCGVQEPLNDVWTYDLKRFQWRCVSVCADDMHAPAGKNLTAPSHRFSSACAFDTLGWTFMLLHGGTRPIMFDDKYISETQPEEHEHRESFEYGCDDLWMWAQYDDRSEWRQLHTSVAQALGGSSRPLEVKRTGHCVFVHDDKLYMYGGYYKDSSETSTYCNDFVVLNLQNVFSELSAAKHSSSAPLPPRQAAMDAGDEDGSNCHMLILRRVLAAVGATSSVRHMLDDGVDDDDIAALSLTQPHKVATKYRMDENQAQQFVDACRRFCEDQQLQQQQEQQGRAASFSTSIRTIDAAEEASAYGIQSQDSESSQKDSQVALSQNYQRDHSERLRSILQRRNTSARNPFGNRMQMNSYVTLGQFHLGALHVALKSLFTHSLDADVLKESDEVNDMVVDDSEFFFRLKVFTSDSFGAGTDADVFVVLVDARGRETNEITLDLSKCELALKNEKIHAAGGQPDNVTIDLFEKGSCDSFLIRPLIRGKFRPADIASIKVRISTEDLVHRAGLDWGADSMLLEDLRDGASTYFPAKTWLTNRKKEATFYADRDTPPLRVRLKFYSELMRTVPKKQPDGSWDSISKRRSRNRDEKLGTASGSLSFGIRCLDLPKLDAASDSDPMVVVTVKTGLSTWRELYRTEVILDSNNPVFKKRKEIAFSPEATTWIKFSVYDVDDADGLLVSAQDFCGYATVTLQTLAEMGSLGSECKFPLMRGEQVAGSVIIQDVNVVLKPPSLANAHVCVRDVQVWLQEPNSYIRDGAVICRDSNEVLSAIGAQSVNELLATFSIAEDYISEKMQETCMLTRSAFELLREDPASANQFYSFCHGASQFYKKMRNQVSDGFISVAMEESHAVMLEINSKICSSMFPPMFDMVCMKYKILLENFFVVCSYAAKADLHARLQFQIKIRDELQAAVQFTQEEEDKVANNVGTMTEVQEALTKQLDQLRYLAPQLAVGSLTGDTPDSLAILKQAYSTFDIDGDGVITDSEVKTLLKGLGVHVSHESLSDLFARFDKDGNNALDFNEFIMMMRSMKQNFSEQSTSASAPRVRVTPLNSSQLNQRLHLRRMRIDGLHASAHCPDAAAADFFSVADSSVKFAPAASGRASARKCPPMSLVHTLMAGGGGSALPSGVVPLGQEKRAIESLLQNGYFPTPVLQSAATVIRPWSAVTSADVVGMSASMAAKEAQRRAELLSQARKFTKMNTNSTL